VQPGIAYNLAAKGGFWLKLPFAIFRAGLTATALL